MPFCLNLYNLNKFETYIDDEEIKSAAYALEGSIYSCGNIVNWMKNKLKLFHDINETEKIINVNGESNNVMFLPAFNGLGTPYWNSEIRAGFYGMTQDTNKSDLITNGITPGGLINSPTSMKSRSERITPSSDNSFIGN